MMALAFATAERGTCYKQKVGAVITFLNRVKATGYNSSLSGNEHCQGPNNCLQDHNGRCKKVTHSEISAYLSWTDPQHGFTIYVTHEPCTNCYQFLANAGCRRVVYYYPYTSNRNEQILKKQLVEELKLPEERFPHKLQVNIDIEVKH